MIKARIINVIETRLGNEITFFTLEGLEIGGFNQGQRIEPIVKKEEIKPQGGIVTSPKPQEVKRNQERETERLMSSEERIKVIPR